MSAFGEIAALAQLARPSVGVVTTIAPAHLRASARSRACSRRRPSWFRRSCLTAPSLNAD
jgi:UDP-N-acetylmuramyl pentapeptide synthase